VARLGAVRQIRHASHHARRVEGVMLPASEQLPPRERGDAKREQQRVLRFHAARPIKSRPSAIIPIRTACILDACGRGDCVPIWGSGAGVVRKSYLQPFRPNAMNQGAYQVLFACRCLFFTLKSKPSSRPPIRGRCRASSKARVAHWSSRERTNRTHPLIRIERGRAKRRGGESERQRECGLANICQNYAEG